MYEPDRGRRNRIQQVQIDLDCHLSRLKTALDGLLYLPTVPTEVALLYFIAPAVQLPLGDLSSTALKVEMRCRMFLEDIDAGIRMHTVEVFPEAASGAKRSWSA